MTPPFSQDFPLADLVLRGIEAIFALVLGWFAWEARTLKEKVGGLADEFGKWRTHLLGIDGASGLTGQVKALERRAYRWDTQLGKHETWLVVTNTRLDRLETDRELPRHRPPFPPESDV